MNPVPQVVAITRVSPAGAVRMKNALLSHLDIDGCCCRVRIGDERAPRMISVDGASLALSADITQRLKLDERRHVAFVGEPAGMRLQGIRLIVDEGESVSAFDADYGNYIERTLMQSPSPDRVSTYWQKIAQPLRLRFSVSRFLAKRRSLASHLSRLLIGTATTEDADFADRLTKMISSSQESDGSWEQDLVLTAKNIDTLLAVGCHPSTDAVQRGCTWLLNTRGSPHNPGMFFLSEELAAEQIEVVKQRAAGDRARFRSRKKTEMRRVNVYDPLIIEPCGPRIMWPNASALNALLAAGYEGHPRVKKNIATLMDRRWCECGYQHGIDDASPGLDEETVAAIEEDAAQEYRMGGLSSPEELLHMDSVKTSGRRMKRAREERRHDHIRFELDFDGDFPTCGFVTMEALGRVCDPLARRFADARMMRMAANMPKTSQRTVDETVRFWRSPYAAALRGFHKYRHPAARAVIFRAVSWITENQNDDGSWGEDPYKDDTTLAILKALTNISSDLPNLGLS